MSIPAIDLNPSFSQGGIDAGMDIIDRFSFATFQPFNKFPFIEVKLPSFFKMGDMLFRTFSVKSRFCNSDKCCCLVCVENGVDIIMVYYYFLIQSSLDSIFYQGSDLVF